MAARALAHIFLPAILYSPSIHICSALVALATACADDWPQFRGPNRDAVWNETGIMQTFPPEGLRAEWRAPVGYGMSSPVVSQGRVYLIDSEVQKPRAWESM